MYIKTLGLAILFVFTINATLYGQTGENLICEQYPSLSDDFSPLKPNYHAYSVQTEICSIEEFVNVTKEKIFEILLKRNDFVAPSFDKEPVHSCTQINANVGALPHLPNVFNDDPIVTVVDNSRFSVTNYTLPGHRLYNGKVVREIIQQGGRIYIRTRGTGNNENEFYADANNNKYVMSKLWSHVDKPFVEEVRKRLQEEKKLKDAAINFYKWAETVWETPATSKRLESFKVILNKQGKPEEDDGYGCPCSINWKEVDKFFSWVKSISTLISDDYFLDSKKAMKMIEGKFKTAKTEQEYLELVEEFYIDGMFHLFPGNGGPPIFSQSGIYSKNAIWDIQIENDGTAYVNTTFRMPADWNNNVGSYKLKMIKERGIWKVTAPVMEGNISPSFDQLLTNHVGVTQAPISNHNPPRIPKTIAKNSKILWYTWNSLPSSDKNRLRVFYASEGKNVYDEIIESLENGCDIKVAKVDLDGDRDDGYLVYKYGCTYWCGTIGCTLDVFEKKGRKQIHMGIYEELLNKVKVAQNGIISPSGVYFKLKDE